MFTKKSQKISKRKKKKTGKTSLIVIKGFILCFVEYMLPFSVLGSPSVG